MLFFIPGAKAIREGLLAEHGLDRLVVNPHSRESMSGPDGPGLLIADESVPIAQLRYSSTEQKWSKRFGHKSWVGTWYDSQPTPDDLARPRMVEGTSVKMLDGNLWVIPTLRQWQDGDPQVSYETTLPRVMTQDPESGRYVLSEVVPEYREIWKHSERIADLLFSQLAEKDAAEIEYHDFVTYATQLLSVNYRLDTSVISHLELLSQSNANEIVTASLEWQALRDCLKKRLGQSA